MKKIVGIIAAVLMVIGFAAPASAAPANANDRAEITYVLYAAWDQTSYSDQDGLCYAWNYGMRGMVYSELGSVIRAEGYSRYDTNLSIRRFFNRVC